MRIGFDISQTGVGKAGCGYFADAMIRGLISLYPNNEYVLFPSFGDFFFDSTLQAENPAYRHQNVHYGPRHATKLDASRYWLSPNLDSQLPELDILHANNFWCPRQHVSTRLVYTLYDLGFVEEPDWTTEVNRVGCFAGMFGAAIAADWIVAISRATRDHFLRTFPSFPPERIEVIYPCSRFVDTKTGGLRPKQLKHLKTGQFILSVGTIEPRKNQKMLVEAYARYIAAGGPRIPLVLAGGAGWLMEEFPLYLEKLELTDLVILTGYLTDEELIWLYKNCRVHIYVSLFEGFGLPVLEGMQFGAPTIASNSTSIPEITSDSAILVDPLSCDEIANALLEVGRSDPQRNALSVKAQRRVADFKWEMSVVALLSLYQRIMEAPKRRSND